MIRLFTAIALPVTIRQRLGLLQGGLPGAQWSAIDNLHLTLRFIGDVQPVVADDIDDMLSSLRLPSFELSLSGVGEFGGQNPNSVWVGVLPSEPLVRLAAKLENALQRMGLEAEARKYTPHVTLARLHETPLQKVREFLADHSMFNSGPFPVASFGLYSSQRSSRGSVYSLESQYQLGS